MIYYTQEARDSAMKEIEDLMKKVGQVKGTELNYLEARAITKHLGMMHDLIAKEFKEHAKD